MGISIFRAFRANYNLPSIWPPSPDQIINFLAYLASTGKTYATVKCYLAGISFNLNLNNHPDPCQFFIVRKMLQGLRKLKNSKDVRSPITLPLLNKITSALIHICTNSYEATLFASAFSLAYFGLLRVGELTAANRLNNKPTLAFIDVLMSNTSITLIINKSKTDQLGSGTTLEIHRSLETENLFHILGSYLRMRPKGPVAFMCHMDGSPLTSYQFSKILQKAVAFLGIDTKTFKSHSLRIGHATHLANIGASDSEIMQKGRWKSNAYKSYIRQSKIVL